jgi:hypothetical protein
MALAHSPRIVTDGLVLCLDAASPKNYNLTAVEVLVVAGGGAGGYGEANQNGGGGGGGGAGGLIYNSNFAVTPGSALTVTVGGGGAVVTNSTTTGGNGGNSVFGSLTAIGGGGGGGGDFEGTNAGATGGSGGGAGGDGTYGPTIFSAGTAGQGFAGGARNGTTRRAAGGGGGAGGAGSSGTPGANNTGTGGTGGSGLGFDISGTFTYYAGGGGGGASLNFSSGVVNSSGGIGGGGAGGGATGPSNGTANTGGGGGGGFGSNAGTGGSGIVIVRYPGPQKAIGGTVTSNNGYTIHTFITVGSTTFTPLAATNNSSILGLSDLSGNNRFATTQNSPVYSSSFGGSIAFDGINEYSTFSISNPTTQITVESWIYPERAPSTGTIRGGALSGDPNHYLGLLDSIDGGVTHSLHWALQTSSTRPGSQVGNIPRYAWSHIVGTYDGSRMKAYINGSLVYDVALTGTISGNGNWVLGTYYGTLTDGTHNFDGFIGPSRIYNRALTIEEIKQNYNTTKGRYEKGGINNPFSSPTEARVLGYTSGDYYFQSGSMSSPQLLEFQRDYYENRGWVCAFRSPYRSTATTNKINLNIPMGGLLVQRDTLDLRAAVYWSTPITYNSVGGIGNNTADSGYSPRRVILGQSGGHGIYATNQQQCNWGSAAGAIGAGWDGSTCGSFPNDLVWGTGRSDTATYENRSGTWSHWITW